MKIKKFQAKHIPDVGFLLTVSMLQKTSYILKGYEVAMTWELEEVMPHIPNKLIRAKANQLIKRGFLEGCSCGCNGQFEVTEKGKSFIDVRSVLAVTRSRL